MKRRTLLKSALAVPFMGAPGTTTVIAPASACAPRSAEGLRTELRPLDAVLGGILPGSVTAVVGPPKSGKTLLLLELAAQIRERYDTNVLFYDLNGSAVDLRQQLAARKSVRFGRSEEVELPVRMDEPSSPRSRVHIMDSGAVDGSTAYDLALRLRDRSKLGYSLLIIDGWRTYLDRDRPERRMAECASGTLERFADSTLAVHQLTQFKAFAARSRLPVVLGVTTAAWPHDPDSPATVAVDTALRECPDRRVMLERADLYCTTDDGNRRQPNVVTLAGDSPGGRNLRTGALRWNPRAAVYSSL